MTLEKIKDFLRRKNGYVKFGAFKLSTILNTDEDLCYQALGEIRKEFKGASYKRRNLVTKENTNFKSSQDIFKNAFKVDYEIINEYF
jgi:hypothetical protein